MLVLVAQRQLQSNIGTTCLTYSMLKGDVLACTADRQSNALESRLVAMLKYVAKQS